MHTPGIRVSFLSMLSRYSHIVIPIAYSSHQVMEPYVMGICMISHTVCKIFVDFKNWVRDCIERTLPVRMFEYRDLKTFKGIWYCFFTRFLFDKITDLR